MIVVLFIAVISATTSLFVTIYFPARSKQWYIPLSESYQMEALGGKGGNGDGGVVKPRKWLYFVSLVSTVPNIVGKKRFPSFRWRMTVFVPACVSVCLSFFVFISSNFACLF